MTSRSMTYDQCVPVIQALFIAVNEGHEEVVVVLLQCGTPVDATNSDGHTALHLAILVRTDSRESILWHYFCEEDS